MCPHRIWLSEKAVELSEVDYESIVASNAFGVWIVKAISATCAEMKLSFDLGVLNLMCFHSVSHPTRSKKLADICFMLNVEDCHTIYYALKKLVRYELLYSEKQGNEVFYNTTDLGQSLYMAYRDVRVSCLDEDYAVLDCQRIMMYTENLSEVARQLPL